MNGSVDGSKGAAHPSGWMTSATFVEFLIHFKKYSKPAADRNVLLLLDNHESHISIESLEYCKNNNIVLVSFPPHTTHKLQPLDVGVYGPMKKYFNSAMDSWMKCVDNAGKAVTIYDVPKIFSSIYFKAFCDSNILASFKKTGIHPYDRCNFTSEDFNPLYVFDRPMPASDNQQVSAIENPVSAIENPVPDVESSVLPVNNLVPADENSTRNAAIENNLESTRSSDGNTNNTTLNFSFERIRPFPKAGERKTKQNRRTKKSEILTSTPVKDALIKQKKITRSKVAKKTNLSQKNKKKPESRQSSRSESEDEPAEKKNLKKNLIPKKKKKPEKQKQSKENQPENQRPANKKTNTKRIPKRTLTSSSEDSDRDSFKIPSDSDSLADLSEEFDEDNPACFYCSCRYLEQPGEEWIKCGGRCSRWCHVQCAGIFDNVSFLCEFCR